MRRFGNNPSGNTWGTLSEYNTLLLIFENAAYMGGVFFVDTHLLLLPDHITRSARNGASLLKERETFRITTSGTTDSV
jgi:hypothetical protein